MGESQPPTGQRKSTCSAVRRSMQPHSVTQLPALTSGGGRQLAGAHDAIRRYQVLIDYIVHRLERKPCQDSRLSRREQSIRLGGNDFFEPPLVYYFSVPYKTQAKAPHGSGVPNGTPT